MKDILLAVADSLENIAIHVEALETALIGSGQLKKQELEACRALAEHGVRQQLSSLRVAIALLPDDTV